MRSLGSTLTNTPPELDPLPKTGSLAEVPIGKLLRALRRQKLTGALTLEAPPAPLTVIYVNDGDLVAASPDQEDRRLARYFYRAGFLTRAQLEEVLAATTPDHHLADLVVEKEFVSPELRDSAQELHFKGVLFSCLDLRDGTFSYTPLDVVFAPNMQLLLDSDELLAEGTRLVEQAAIVSRELEREDHVYQRVALRTPPQLSAELSALLGWIDGRRSTAELFILSPLERLPTIHQLSQLIEHGLIRKVSTEARRQLEALPSFPLLPDGLEPEPATPGENHNAHELSTEWLHEGETEDPHAEGRHQGETGEPHAGGRHQGETGDPHAEGPGAVEASLESSLLAGAGDLGPTPGEARSEAETGLEQALADAAFASPAEKGLDAAVDADRAAEAPLSRLEEALHREGEESLEAGDAGESAAHAQRAGADQAGDVALRQTEAQLEHALAHHEEPGAEADGEHAAGTGDEHHDEGTPLPDVFENVSQRMSGRRPFGERASHPDEGVFLSAATVLDVVDLTHVKQYHIATDIPLDGIVETMGVEDDEHHMAAMAAQHEHEEHLEHDEQIEQYGDDSVPPLEHEPAYQGDGDPGEAADGDLEMHHAEAGHADMELDEELEDDYESLNPGDIVDHGGPVSWDAEYEEHDGWDDEPAEEDELAPGEAAAALHEEEDFEELRPEDVADMQHHDEEPLPLDEPIFPPQQALSEPPPPREDIDPEPTVEELAELSVEGALEEDEETDGDADLDDPEEELASARTVSIRPGDALLPPLGGLAELSQAANGLPLEDQSSRPLIEERITEREMEVLARIDGIFQHRSGLAAVPRRPRSGEIEESPSPTRLSSTQRGLLRERAEIYNHIFSSIFSALARKSGREWVRQHFQELLKPGNTTHAELFLEVTVRPDGSLDPEMLLKNLDNYPTPRPVEAFDASLNELLSFLLNDVYQHLDAGEQTQLMDSIVKLRNLLYKRALAAG